MITQHTLKSGAGFPTGKASTISSKVAQYIKSVLSQYACGLLSLFCGLALIPLDCVAAKPEPPTLCIDGAAECGVLPPPSAGGMKWHPGHYEISDNGANLANRLSYCDQLSGETAIKGLQVRYIWSNFETTQGNYDFSALEQLLARCQAVGKHLVVEVWTRTFGGSSCGVAPAYIQNIDGANTGVFSTSGGCAVKLWDARIMDRLIALYEALAMRFDGEPNFEMLATGESAQGNGTSGTGYTSAALVTQYLRLFAAGRATWKNTQLRFVGNWLTNGTTAQIVQLMDGLRTYQWTIGGPDIFGNSYTQFQAVFIGAAGGHDYRGEIASAFQVEVASLSKFSLQQIRNRGITDLNNNYFPWMRYWVTPTWNDDILPYLRNNPSTFETCPSGWSCSTD